MKKKKAKSQTKDTALSTIEIRVRGIYGDQSDEGASGNLELILSHLDRLQDRIEHLEKENSKLTNLTNAFRNCLLSLGKGLHHNMTDEEIISRFKEFDD